MVTDAMIAAARDEFLKSVREDYIQHDEVIRRALEAAEKAAWRPISEAPKDGNVRELLGFSARLATPCMSGVGLLTWVPESCRVPGADEAWHFAAHSMSGPIATHFRHLPIPPPSNPMTERLEIRLDDMNGVDEVVAEDCLFHLERMDTDRWFISVTFKDRTGHAFWLGRVKNSVVVTMHESRS